MQGGDCGSVGLILCQLELFPVHRFHQGVDTFIIAVNQHLYEFSTASSTSFGLTISIVGLGSHIEPQLMCHMVADTAQVGLASIEEPAVVIAHTQQLLV